MPARRTGVIHAWDGDAPADFAIDSPVPVYVRDPLTREVLGRGTVASGRLESGNLWADIDWPEDIEALAGDSTPSARCKFDDSGRLVRVVVELDGDDGDEADDPDDHDPSESGDHADPSTYSHDSTYTGDRRAATAGETSPDYRRQAEMAANDKTANFDATQRDQAVTAGHDDVGDPGKDRTPEEIRAENARLQKALAETNRKHKSDRLRLEEIEEAERRKKDEQLSETERTKRDREETARRASEAEHRASEAERRLEEATLERLVEREARKIDFASPELAYRLIDRDRVRKDEETGKWEGVQLAVERLAKDYPHLLSQRRPAYGTPPREEYPGNPARRGNGAGGAAGPQDPFEAAQAAVTYERM